jgi:SAM-dependent methyltransferase
MMGLTSWIDRTFYPAHARNWDDLIFRQRILDAMEPEAVVLDLGAGAGIVEAMNFRGIVSRVCGVDLDSRVESNPFLDEGRMADAGKIPYPDATFDLVFSDNVMEHLDAPEAVLAEASRVLKPGGRLLFKTPNRNHYMAIIARVTPHRFHQWYNKRRGRKEVDTFPTLYRANSPRQVRRLAAATGFAVERIDLVEGRPEYLRIAAPAYLAGLVYERIVNLSDAFSGLRIVMIASLRKP